jgi:hypothetical protein
MQVEPYDAPLMCACGCGGEVKRHRFPSQQTRFLHGHNRRGNRKRVRYIEQDRRSPPRGTARSVSGPRRMARAARSTPTACTTSRRTVPSRRA